MTLDLINNAALVLAMCWLQSLISQRWETGTLKAQFYSGLLFSVATVVVMMTAILLAPGLWLWTDSSMAVVGAITFCYGPLTGGMAAISGILYQWWIGGLSASGAIINLIIAFASGLLFQLICNRANIKASWKVFLLLGLTIYGVGSWQLYYFHLDVSSALSLEYLSTLLIIMAPVTTLLGLQLQFIERKSRLENEVHYLAHYDILTDLPNRNKTINQLESLTGEASGRSTPFSVVILYLQDFQLFNESLGADVGDFMLTETSRRLKLVDEGCYFVSRLAGLEFLLISKKDVQGTDELCRNVRESLCSPIIYHDKKLKLDVAMGVARCPSDADTSYEILRKASLALQAARANKITPIVHFSAEMEEDIQESLDLRKNLILAVDQNELDVYYQPYVSTTDSAVYGIEALVRWNHPQYGLKGPDFFLEAAEKSGLITAVGSWVIEHACKQAKILRDQGISFSTISVNVSLVQLADYNFPNIIAEILDKTGLSADTLMLEIAETAIARQSEMIFRSTKTLGEMGVRFAIDNFGADYTNISFMKQVGVHMIKVDRAYIADITTKKENVEIVQAFIQIAKSLNIRSLAVGVEDDTVKQFCLELGFDMAQGYFYSKPLDETDLINFLSSNHR